MKRILRNIIICLALVPVLPACQSGDEPAPAPGGEDAPVCSFSIYIATDKGTGSRAPSDGEYNPGAGFENYIDISGEDFSIAIYDKDNAWMANVESAVIVPFDDNFLSSKRYLLQCNLDRETAEAINDKGSIKLVMMANWRHKYPVLDETSHLTTLFDAATAMDYKNGLPGPDLTRDDKIAMFGVCQYDGVELKPNIVTELGTLHLLRALAKIEVWDAPETVKPIQSVTLTRRKKGAMPMPLGVTHQNHYIKNQYDGDYVLTPSFSTELDNMDAEITEPIALIKDEKGHFIIYSPEFRNKGRLTDNLRARLAVSYDDGDTFYIDFTQNSVNIDILRNYWYKFEINRTTYEINPKVDVLPYGVTHLDPSFGIDPNLPQN